METTPVSELFSMLNESLFRVGEKKHLTAMKQGSLTRESGAHSDMLSKVHDSHDTTAHQQRIEHHGLKFWTYYFENEHPDIDQPLPDYMDKAWDENLQLQARSIDPPLTHVVPSIDGVGETELEISKRWVKAHTLAQLAFHDKDYVEAERNYRLALDESDKLDKKRSRKKSLAAKGLAESLEQQGRIEDAERYFELALLIDEEILGTGDVTLEDEFYGLAKHFLDHGKGREIEELFDDLLKRLRMSVGRNDPMMARYLNELAIVYCSEQKWQHAESAFQKAIDTLEQFRYCPKRQLAAVHNNYASMCESCDRQEDARTHYKKALDYLCTC